MAASEDNVKGLVLAVSSSLFIGSSFIVKKKGLRAAGASGLRAGARTADLREKRTACLWRCLRFGSSNMASLVL